MRTSEKEGAAACMQAVSGMSLSVTAQEAVSTYCESRTQTQNELLLLEHSTEVHGRGKRMHT